MTIFVSIASYLDPELESTIDSCLSMAASPESVHIGIFDQSYNQNSSLANTSNASYKWVHYTEALGAGFARSEVQKMYRGEDYFLQIDAHSVFTKFWDRRLIQWLDKLPKKSIISMWPMPYTRKNGKVILNKHEQGKWPVQAPHKTVASRYGRSWVGARRPLTGEYEWSQVGLGGLWFCEGRFVNHVPYDPRISWHGEEFLLSVRAFDMGYEVYGVNDTFLYHNYARHGHPRVWDNDKEWKMKQAEAVGIQSDILNFCDESPYSLLHPERLQEYMDRSGLDDLQKVAKNQAVRLGVRNKNACSPALQAVY